MKVDRLLAIIMMLIKKKRVQAKDLAELFDVSVRTIYRDIDAINLAGIPIITYQGSNGGIEIAEGYRLDKNVLTNDELASIAVALKSISSSYDDLHIEPLLEKIRGVVPQSQTEAFKAKSEHFFVDFTPWGNDGTLKQKISKLKEGIRLSRRVEFTYQNTKGEILKRLVEPYTIVLKENKWYLYGFCLLREEFRLFKVSRMKHVEVLDTEYHREELVLEELPWNQGWFDSSEAVELVLKFDKDLRMFVEEQFGTEKVSSDEAGDYILKITFPMSDWVYGFILSFGHKVEVIEPDFIREAIRESALSLLKIYDKQV
ncbi:MAG: helix-turn-helix transcriptional regulator [Bacillota bacterium]